LRLSIERRETTSTTVVIVVKIESSAAGLVTVGCVVDAVSDVSNVGAETIGAAPAICGSVDSHFLRGVSSLESRLVMFLDLTRLIDESVIAHAPAVVQAA
jgi:purine-binding chemotaxis protein CheW